ncbi:MAG: DUF554 domain-containing protein [Prevotellaceae bacterium]|jgi:uncharacterized membrane protein YqgA involved in biofilm formation|nr:DUF554 domain-containing protein [Prevotellaceae bacterium]
MTGTLINAGTVVAGSAIGMILKNKLSVKYETVYFQIVGLFTLILGIKMSLNMSSPLLVVLSLVAGGFAGTRLKLEENTEHLGNRLKSFLKSENDRFAEGLTTGFLLFCMGSMTVIGAIEEGFGKTSDLLITKSVMDFFSAIMLASALGAGVLFSFIPLIVFQGGITALVSIAGRDIPTEITSEITVVGGIMLVGLSFNLLKIKNIPVINMLPALIFICVGIWLKLVLPLTN